MKRKKENDVVSVDYTAPQDVDAVAIKVKKPTLADKFASVFLSSEIDDVKTYIWQDIIIPAIKTTISDIIKNGIDMLMFGETKASKINNGATYVSYSSYYAANGRGRGEVVASKDPRSENYKLEFTSRGIAEQVRDDFLEIFQTYPAASVADLCECASRYMPNGYEIHANWNDSNWGWYNLTLRDAEIKMLYGGTWTIRLPKPVYLNGK